MRLKWKFYFYLNEHISKNKDMGLFAGPKSHGSKYYLPVEKVRLINYNLVDIINVIILLYEFG